MRRVRRCRRPGCESPAVATLTSVYADPSFGLGARATEPQPGGYARCAKNVESLACPRGWRVIRLATDFEPAPPSDDALTARADAVREASRAPRPKPQPAEHSGRPGGILPASLTQAPDTLPDHLVGLGDGEIMRRGHLRVLRGEKED